MYGLSRDAIGGVKIRFGWLPCDREGTSAMVGRDETNVTCWFRVGCRSGDGLDAHRSTGGYWTARSTGTAELYTHFWNAEGWVRINGRKLSVSARLEAS